VDKTIEQLFLEATYPDPAVPYKGHLLKRVDYFPVRDGGRIRVVLEHVGSEWRQAVRLQSDTLLEIGELHGENFILWSDTAPPETVCVCHSRAGEIVVYNAWDAGKGTTDAWIGNAAMIVEELPRGRRYRCNDSHQNDDFTDLVFRVERMDE
jgi:hypothetical protein